MKLLSILFLIFLFSLSLHSQQFLWAESYDISNCNEVAAVSLDTSGYIFISGIHNAPSSVPYTGNSYLQKTDPEGEVVWTEYFNGSLHIGDMVAINNGVVIIGQSGGSFTYQNEEYGTNAYFMFMFKVDTDGNHEWHIIDATKHGTYTNLAAGKLGNFAAHVRGQGNLGDWIWILNEEGDILDTKVISASETTIVDIAYYDDWVYLNGGFNGPGSLIIDTIVINVQPIENTTFTLALDEDLTAKWVATDTTINNFDGRIVADGTGVFVFESVLEPPFTFQNYIKKFSFEGQLTSEIVPPVFSTAIAVYPDLTITANILGFFVKNDFNSNSHAVFLFDHNLNLMDEKIISGSSSPYSGQIANFGDDLFVAQVFAGQLNFNNELILPYSGTGNLPYIAKIGMPPAVGIHEGIESEDHFIVYPNPADDIITITISHPEFINGTLIISDIAGNNIRHQTINKNKFTIDISDLQTGVYLIQVLMNKKIIGYKKIIIQ